MALTILVFSSFPTPAEERDGYFQRVLEVDDLLSSFNRVYVTFKETPHIIPVISRIRPRVWTLNINPSKIIQFPFLLLAVALSRRIYCHSVFNLARRIARVALQVPFCKSVLDVHGVVPEELRYNGDLELAARFDTVEQKALQHVSCCVVVTEVMVKHLKEKYRALFFPPSILFPILNTGPIPSNAKNTYNPASPRLIYAGGIQKWQQIDKMIASIKKVSNKARTWLFTGDADALKVQASEAGLTETEIRSVSKNELSTYYQQSNFGFVLREDVLLNRVACPTKLIEYLQHNIVPIMNSSHLGDFESLGMKYFNLDDLESGNFPGENEYRDMQNANREVLRKLEALSLKGREKILSFLN